MLKNISKKFMLFSMIFLLNNSVIGTIAYATEQNNTISSSTDSSISAGTSDKNLENKDSSKNTLTETSKDSVTTVTDKNLKKDDKLDNKLVDKKIAEFIDYGWKTINNKKYYIVNNKISETTGWFMEKNLNPNINSKNKNYDIKYYLDKDFSVVVGWKKVENNWYYFNPDGIMQTGWVIDNNSYYLDKSGIMETGWIKIDGYSYYFDQYGHAAIGKKLIDNNWYFFNNKGILEKGFYYYNEKTYYSDEDGIMVTNQWLQKGKHKYYIKSDSSIAIGDLFLNGITEKFNTNGFYEGTSSNNENDLYIHYLDVGNADCAFIKLPSGETVLIDTGDTTTSKTLINFLNNQNLKTEFFVPKIDGQVTTTAGSAFVTTSSNNTNKLNTPKLNNGKGVIDYVVLTHPHSDHIGGMIELMKNFNIGKVIVPKYFELKDWTSGVTATEKNKSEINLLEYDYKIYKDTMDALSKDGLPIIEAEPQGYIDSEKILQFLSINKDYTNIASKNFYDAYWATNDNSAIVYLNYYDLQGLFTGDIQWNAENDFVSRKALKNNQVDILKVPHHGNVGSSSYTFIGYVQPTIGVITRAKEAINTNSEPYDVLTTCGVNIYELSATNGLSVYATKDNWNIENK